MKDVDFIQTDVEKAFLQDKIKENIFIKIPDGVKISENTQTLKLQKVLYGLKTNGRDRFTRLKDEISKLNFKRSIVDKCLFYHICNTKLAIMPVHIDIFLCLVHKNASNYASCLADGDARTTSKICTCKRRLMLVNQHGACECAGVCKEVEKLQLLWCK